MKLEQQGIPQIRKNTTESILHSSETDKIHQPPLVCLVDSGHIDGMTQKNISEIEKSGEYVNFSGDRSFTKEYHMLNQDRGTYIISNINEKDKYSKSFFNCTGLVGFGIDKDTKQVVSFLSHQNPDSFLGVHKTDFIQDMKKTLLAFNEKIVPKSMSVMGFGGHYDEEYQKEYLSSCAMLSKLVQEYTKKELEFITGPNMAFKKDEHGVVTGLEGPTSIFVNTKNKRIFLLRPHQENNTLNHNFTKKEILSKDLLWRNREE